VQPGVIDVANQWGMPLQCTIKAASASSVRSHPSKRAGRSGEREWGLSPAATCVDVGCEVDEGRDRTQRRKRLRVRRGSRDRREREQGEEREDRAWRKAS
jgi:hypothetical protein